MTQRQQPQEHQTDSPSQARIDTAVRCTEGPAAGTWQQALLDAAEKLRQAEGSAEAKLEQALLDAGEKLRLAEDRAEGKLEQARIDANKKLRCAEIAAEAILQEARFDADEKLRQAQDALALQQEVLERFFTLSLDMMCIVSAGGHFKRISPAFEALGYTNEELLGRAFSDFAHPADASVPSAGPEQPTRTLPTARFDNRFRCKNGSYRWLAWTVAPDTSGTLYAIARDVTESKRTQQALMSAKLAADDVNRELESFSYSVAHDLRAPLRSIDGFSQALLEDYADKLDEGGRKYLRIVRESAQLMAQLIDDLLTLSRVSRQDLERSSVNLSDLVRATCARLRKVAPERNVEVVIRDGVMCRGDSRLMAVVVDNLLGNAWKFTGQRPLAHIEFGTTTKAGATVYFIRDDGAGFDMTYAAKLFGAFQRLHAVHEFEGTGVGLATVQRIVHRHGGRVWADGKVDAGATFSFTLDEGEPVV